ncbi:nucleotidyltransferase domain-containing protein [Niastella caeni]|uniref:Nucleotidyltransferase domain-containing protein n=1 Tax=Niastella caeni TaxID=2569763 RepID=A0A4S8H8Z6_9BACT|nr:nucleotidyltransferase domain-containing protein [Niastella caeni]THU31163.1 nucleotidyltransferase domain-containing protein [Niastella caeni]
MIVTGNPLLTGVSGKLKNLVVKQYKDKTVVTAVPDMSGRKLSQKQKDANERMQFAIISAKKITADPRLKQRACELLQVPPNKVFRAIVKKFLLTDGYGSIFEETEQEILDKKTLATLKAIITTEIPDAELMLFGNRAKGAYDAQSDWDILILTSNNYPKTRKWELQEKLFKVTIQQGTRVNILVAQKAKWHTEQDYETLRKRIEKDLLPIK